MNAYSFQFALVIPHICCFQAFSIHHSFARKIAPQRGYSYYFNFKKGKEFINKCTKRNVIFIKIIF